jgi:N-acetyl-gamma-glutamyl-phosphate reductase
LSYQPQDQSVSLCAGMDVAFLATPAEVSLALAPQILSAHPKTRVIDLSGAFRLADAAAYPSYYGFEHIQTEWLGRAVYGLPELFRGQIPGARLIANPGCYATVAALALAPLLKAKLLDEKSLIVDAASGTTGAGRRANEEMSFSEVDEDFRAYKVHKHQHTPEIIQTLSRASGLSVALTFTPHLLPLKRGILVTAYARLRPGVDPKAPSATIAQAWADSPFVQVLGSADEVSLKGVVGTNRCTVGVAAPPDASAPLVVCAAIDNLVKGAAGQALQNLNLAAGWPEGLGLDGLRGFYP